MRTARRLLTGLAVAAAAAASDAGPDGDSALRGRVQQLVEMIATGDDASRRAAADEIVKLGRPAVPHVSRFAHLLRDTGPREVVVSAFARIGLDETIALLLANRASWSPAGKDDVRTLVAALRSRRDPKLAVVVPLEPTLATNAARVPPDAEFEIGEALPEALAWDVFPVRKTKTGITVEVEPGRLETVEADKPRAIRVGPRKRPLLVYRRLDRWYAASASLLAGRHRTADVELWDADLDGSFVGARDFVRFGDGAFQRPPEDGLVVGPQGLAAASFRTVAPATATFFPEPLPADVGEWALRGLATLNEWRAGVALPPVVLNLPRSASCARHVDYWRQNGYSGHDEAPDRPGFTQDGAAAGKKSSVSQTADPATLLRTVSATVLHRATCLGEAADGLGVAYASGSCLWGGDLGASGRGFPILVPGPGEDAAPSACEAEQPPPTRDPNYYAQAHGYPVAVVWKGSWDDVKNARIELFALGPSGATELLAGELFSPETPYTDRGRPIEVGAAVFVADKPLDRRKSFVARFRCDRETGPAEFTWAFATK
jgi:hypothetical protein